MGKEQILQKLSIKLQHSPISEEDVVYILSRIRKILETNNYPKKYTVLNFYCNLALHSKIGRPPKEVSDKLRDIQEDTDLTADYSMTYFGDFHAQLENFLTDYDLPNFYDNDSRKANFNKLLYAIYSDTPIIIEGVTRYKIIYRDDGTMDGSPVDD